MDGVGYNAYGQLGNDPTIDSPVPVTVVGFYSDWSQLVAQRMHRNRGMTGRAFRSTDLPSWARSFRSAVDHSSGDAGAGVGECLSEGRAVTIRSAVPASSFEVEFVPNNRNALPEYRGADHLLLYRSACMCDPCRINAASASIDVAMMQVELPPRWFAMADRLLLTFSGRDAELTAFEAFTRMGGWTRVNELAPPSVDAEGRVRLACSPVSDERIELDAIPHYLYSEAEGRLRIELGKGRRGRAHYQVSDTLIVGVDDRGIASLDVSALQIV